MFEEIRNNNGSRGKALSDLKSWFVMKGSATRKEFRPSFPYLFSAYNIPFKVLLFSHVLVLHLKCILRSLFDQMNIQAGRHSLNS